MLIASAYNTSQGKVSFASLLQNKLAVRRVKLNRLEELTDQQHYRIKNTHLLGLQNNRSQQANMPKGEYIHIYPIYKLEVHYSTVLMCHHFLQIETLK